MLATMLFPILVSFLAYAFIVDRRRLALERNRLRLELSYVKAQINPRLLFHTLGTLQHLTRARDPQAGDVVLHLADLLRYTLYETDAERVPPRPGAGFPGRLPGPGAPAPPPRPHHPRSSRHRYRPAARAPAAAPALRAAARRPQRRRGPGRGDQPRASRRPHADWHAAARGRRAAPLRPPPGPGSRPAAVAAAIPGAAHVASARGGGAGGSLF